MNESFLMGQPRPLLGLYSVFLNKQYNFKQQINVKNVHPVQGAGFRTHDARIFCIRNECFLNGSFTASFYVFLHTVD